MSKWIKTRLTFLLLDTSNQSNVIRIKPVAIQLLNQNTSINIGVEIFSYENRVFFERARSYALHRCSFSVVVVVVVVVFLM